jgi:peptidylprolyl isomerase
MEKAMRLNNLLTVVLIAAVLLAACSSPAASPAAPTADPRLKIEDEITGTGDEAQIGTVLLLNYTGYLENGTKFDSSVDNGQPFTFVLGSGMVIKGWDQGLVGMKVGGKRKLTVPPDLAYGSTGAGGVIPPNATLIFEIDLLGVQPGVKIEDLKVGDGTEAQPGDKVSVHYTGWLENGAKFDSSLDRGQPFAFQIGAGEVIQGWDVGVTGMKVGGKRRLTIPPYLGYGTQGAGGVIPANATLIFEIELLEVQK